MGSKGKVGCGGCFLLTFLIFCCIGVIGVGATVYISNSQFYEMAVEAAQENPRARDVLGTPIEGGWLVTQFSVQRNGDSGTASLEVPVSGPRASGTVYFNAIFQDGSWKTEKAELEVDGERFSLGR